MIHRPELDPRRLHEIEAALRHASPSDVRHKMLMSPRMMPAGGGGGGGGGALTGTVTNQSGGAGVAATTLERWSSGGVFLDSTTTDGSGNYSFASATAGDLIRCHPPVNYCIADAGEFNVSGATMNFSVQVPVAPWKEVLTEGSNISDQATIEALWTTGSAARSTYGWSESLGGTIDVDMTGGPNGGRAVRLNFPDLTSFGCGHDYTLAYQPRLFPSPTLVGGEVWCVQQDKFETGWQHGLNGCAPIAYKSFLVQFEKDSAPTGLSRLGLYWGASSAVNPVDFRLVYDWSTDNGGVAIGPTSGTNYLTTLANQHARWVWGITGIGGANATAKLYRNGVLFQTVGPTSILPGVTINGGYEIILELGANINNGPGQGQKRWVTSWGMYPTRPRLLMA